MATTIDFLHIAVEDRFDRIVTDGKVPMFPSRARHALEVNEETNSDLLGNGERYVLVYRVHTVRAGRPAVVVAI